MQSDIYTGRPIVTRSDEHLLLNALGGRLVSRDLIDKTTNDRFGNTIDAAVARSLGSLRTILNAASGENRPPPQVRAMATDGTPYNVCPGGFRLEPAKPSLRVFKDESGALCVEGYARSRAELNRHLARPLRENNFPPEAAARLHVVATQTPASELSFSMSFPLESYRAIAKMACNLFAYRNPGVFESSAFDAIRRFVAAGEGDVSHFVQVNAQPLDLTDSGIADLDHLVLVGGGDGCVEAIVCVFNHLRFSVRLATERGGHVTKTAYRVDQLGRQDRLDDPTDLALPLPSFSQNAALPYSALLESIETAIQRLLCTVMEKQADLFLHSLVEDAFRELAQPGELVSVDDVIERVLRRYVALRGPARRPQLSSLSVPRGSDARGGVRCECISCCRSSAVPHVLVRPML